MTPLPMKPDITMTWPQYLRGECTYRLGNSHARIHLTHWEKEYMLLLLVNRGRNVSLDTFIDILYGEYTELENPRGQVRIYIHRIRKKLPGLIISSGNRDKCGNNRNKTFNHSSGYMIELPEPAQKDLKGAHNIPS